MVANRRPVGCCGRMQRVLSFVRLSNCNSTLNKNFSSFLPLAWSLYLESFWQHFILFISWTVLAWVSIGDPNCWDREPAGGCFKPRTLGKKAEPTRKGAWKSTSIIFCDRGSAGSHLFCPSCFRNCFLPWNKASHQSCLPGQVTRWS